MVNSPLTLARLTGFFWLLTIITGFMALSFRGPVGLASNVTASLTYIGAAFFAASLMKPVNGNLAILTGVLGILGSFLGLERALLKVLPVTNNLSFLFFGTQCALLGYLTYKSGFLPRWVGGLLAFGGLGWLALGLTGVLAITLPTRLAPFILIPGVVGETVLTAWLLIKGVDVSKWEKGPE